MSIKLDLTFRQVLFARQIKGLKYVHKIVKFYSKFISFVYKFQNYYLYIVLLSYRYYFPTFWFKQNSHLSDQTNRTIEKYCCRSRHPLQKLILQHKSRSTPSRTYSLQYVPFNRNSISERCPIFLEDLIKWRRVSESKTEP
jgi:hypothetical protein